MKQNLIKSLVSICIIALLITSFTGCSEKKDIASGSTWEVAEITALDSLTIADGAVIKAPEGYSLTMTVDGVETGITPGEYEGEIVLTPTEDILKDGYNFRTAVYIENGKYVPEKSVVAAVKSGAVTDTSATDLKITSVGEKFNGIMVTGDSESSYSIVNPVINFTGNGANDFVGYGAAIATAGKAEVMIDNANINNTGAARTAIWVGGNSITTVNNSYIEVHNGILPADYEFSVAPGKMMEVPWMLGTKGNLRATNLADNGTVYYNNTHIKAQGWGCLSSDNVGESPSINATNCLIETVESGYGAFSLGTNVATFSNCTFNVKDYGLISQDGDGVFTDGTVVNSERFGAMFFGSGAYLTIDKGSEFNTKSTAIQIKGGSTDIVVDSAKLNPGNGIILQVMANDDPYMSSMFGGGGRGGGGGMPPSSGMPPGGGMPGGTGGDRQGGPPGGGDMPGGAGGAPPQGGMPPGGGMPGGTGGGGSAASSKDVNATFSNITLAGDIINANTASGALSVTLKNATINGAITTATIEHTRGPNGEEVTMEHPELYYLIGEVINTFCATDDEYGVRVSLDSGSTWVVDETSYLTELTIAEGAAVNAPEGSTVTMTVNGAAKAIKAGAYKGKIVLTVLK